MVPRRVDLAGVSVPLVEIDLAATALLGTVLIRRTLFA